MRKTHLQDTRSFGPTCQSGRSGGQLRGEHITVKFSEFRAESPELLCSRCATSKLFVFLQRRQAERDDVHSRISNSSAINLE